jgi:hypothetical protein
LIKLNKIKPNPDNPRIIKDYRFEKLCKSLTEFPTMMELRPIVVDENYMILGGNMRLKALQNLGYKEIPDEWIKRNTELTNEQKERFILTDNSNFGEWDFEILANQFDSQLIIDCGIEIPVYGSEESEETENEEIDNTYTKKIKAPIYEPKNEKPELKVLYDNSKVSELEKEIETADIPKEIKDFLRAAAQRHRVFNYSLIADYYAHSKPEIQSLMEKSALVIIDFNKAIENGFVKLTKEIAELYGDEYGNEN